ncbi:hypothetical protein CONLIGDRAFT_686916 [Coniochaeta ligniaria NRRL 30616]|uniref:Uncharacterized protein n=1 Tax=Coniochaeta ligniaria NRRL 30616 TaxID=1408157 RepID=A0A1J7I6U4_9PEZI|nr:hypothetical protein CONLIGDRAFT_686916 [Coniochaeta ligniaria NRRL 30616]
MRRRETSAFGGSRAVVRIREDREAQTAWVWLFAVDTNYPRHLRHAGVPAPSVRAKFGTGTIHCPPDGHHRCNGLEEEERDTSMVFEYGEEVFAYLYKLQDEVTVAPNPHFMDIQPDISWLSADAGISAAILFVGVFLTTTNSCAKARICSARDPKILATGCLK